VPVETNTEPEMLWKRMMAVPVGAFANGSTTCTAMYRHIYSSGGKNLVLDSFAGRHIDFVWSVSRN